MVWRVKFALGIYPHPDLTPSAEHASTDASFYV